MDITDVEEETKYEERRKKTKTAAVGIDIKRFSNFLFGAATPKDKLNRLTLRYSETETTFIIHDIK